MATDAPERPGHARRVARNTAFFSFATGLSRLLGLVREVVAAKYFGVTAAMSAFTIAFQVPNLVRALFADSALQGAFVPVFSELLEKGERKEAFRVASSLFFLITLVIAALTALFVLFAEPIMSVIAPGFDDDPALAELTVNLARLMFPIVLLLALTGLVVGMLNSFEHFAVPALAPVAWNLVIIAALVGLVPVMPEGDEIYAYAIGILAGTVVQFLLPLPLATRAGRTPHVPDRLARRARPARPEADAAGDARARPDQRQPPDQLRVRHAGLALGAGRDRQGVPHLPAAPGPVQHRGGHDPVPDHVALRRPGRARRPPPHDGHGVRQICLLLIPSAVLMAVLAVPITRLVYERGVFGTEATDLTSTALVWWSISLPFQGVSLLFSRTFFSLQQPWATTALAGLNLVVNATISAALYGPFGIAGIVLGTVVGTTVMCVAQGLILRRELNGIEGRRLASTVVRMIPAAVLLGAVAYFTWKGLDEALGRSFAAQAVSVLTAIGAGIAVYAAVVWVLRVPEARQIPRLLLRRGP